MKHLNDIFESIFDIEDNVDQTIIDSIHKFIKDNYKVNSYAIRKELVDGKYVVDARGNVDVKNKLITTLTNDLFIWGKVGDSFNCIGCDSLTTLEGAPKEVGGGFYCSDCNSLTSLEGAPKKVGGAFDCSCCELLKSLKGAPKKVDGGFGCGDCKSLKSFKDAPEKVGGNFYCIGCTSIKDKTIDSIVKGEIYY